MSVPRNPAQRKTKAVGDHESPEHRTGPLVWLALGLLIGAAVAIGGQGLVKRIQPSPIRIVPAEPTTTAVPTPTSSPIFVYVSGQVVIPDVNELPAGSIVKHAIDAAGGFTPNANTSVVNLAQRLTDGIQVHVPSVDEAVSASNPVIRGPQFSSQQGIVSDDGATGRMININTATSDQLETLPGIGPTLAQRIIDFRQDHGPFNSPGEIMNVSGIGAGTFNNLKDLIVTE